MGDISSAVVFRWLAAGDAGDLDTFDELLHPDAVIHAPAGLSTTSADEEKAVWRDALAAMPDILPWNTALVGAGLQRPRAAGPNTGT